MSGRHISLRVLVFMISTFFAVSLSSVGQKTDVKQHIHKWRSQIAQDGSISVVEDSKKPKPVNLNFGGSSHDTMGGGQKNRPEMLKSEVCSPTACKDCGRTAGCWHGDKHNNYDGFLKIWVRPNAPPASYIAEVWARCGDGGGKWQLQIKDLNNGIIEIFVDGKLTRTIDEKKWIAKTGNNYVTIPIKGDARIRISLRPVNTALRAQSRIMLMANGIVPSVESCMTVKDGLKVFGDGSDAAFELRNVNMDQLTCLQKQFEGMSSTLKQKCKEWTQLLSKEQQDTLRVFLSAALGKSGAGMVEVQDRQHLRPSLNGSQSLFPNCVDPSVDDPESWDCECLPSMIQTCSLPKHSKLSLEDCLRSLMCDDPNVCKSWKDEHCEDSLADVSGALDARKEKSLGVAAVALDGSMKGKCGSNEV